MRASVSVCRSRLACVRAHFVPLLASAKPEDEKCSFFTWGVGCQVFPITFTSSSFNRMQLSMSNVRVRVCARVRVRVCTRCLCVTVCMYEQRSVVSLCRLSARYLSSLR